MSKVALRTTMLVIALLNVNLLFSQPGRIESWITNPDRSALFEKQPEVIGFSEKYNGRGSTIVIDDSHRMQSIDGFGFALTGGSAELLMKMSSSGRANILKELFASDDKDIGVSYLRLSIGASDLNSFVFSYNDLQKGETDPELKKFSLSQDYKDVIPVMKEILALNPDIKILGSPWSAPAWMKTNNDVRGGRLKPELYGTYALYFVKYIQAMKNAGITIDAITIQNEPVNSRNTPSMTWFENEQSDFIKNNLGPAFEKAGLKTKIILFDHNGDRPDYPLSMLNDPDVAKYTDGSGFHNYVGDIGAAMSLMHAARPDKNLYFTEQMVVERPGSKEINIASPVKNLIIKTTQNWSRNVILWNLAADPLNDPHTDNGGCSMCQGAITIEGDAVTRNVAWYVVAHASKFIRPGSERIGSTNRGDKTVGIYEDEQRPGVYRTIAGENMEIMPNVAFRTSEGKIVLIVVNDTFSANSFTIQWNGKYAAIRLDPGAAGTFVWQD